LHVAAVVLGSPRADEGHFFFEAFFVAFFAVFLTAFLVALAKVVAPSNREKVELEKVP